MSQDTRKIDEQISYNWLFFLLAGAFGAVTFWAVYDEIDLPLGKLRIRPNGSAGTHNGMRSVVESLASEQFPRLRCGVRGENYEKGGWLGDYVLDDFTSEEQPAVETMIGRAVDALVLFCRDDLRRAMNEFNRDPE